MLALGTVEVSMSSERVQYQKIKFDFLKFRDSCVGDAGGPMVILNFVHSTIMLFAS